MRIWKWEFMKRCFLRHRWNRWEMIQKGSITRKNNQTKESTETGFYETQRRQCDRCGLVQLESRKTEIL